MVARQNQVEIIDLSFFTAMVKIFVHLFTYYRVNSNTFMLYQPDQEFKEDIPPYGPDLQKFRNCFRSISPVMSFAVHFLNFKA